MPSIPVAAMMRTRRKTPQGREKFLVKLFAKSFRERRLFEKRWHPKTFLYSTRAGASVFSGVRGVIAAYKGHETPFCA
ncbi:hypothetical protein FMA36_02530 [Komagataeibacter xylinus]|uniref:Uncharacterized protein n=1 Tax=Komagataeibacter xylinus TaxID=28448 RepID=A0A857FJW6_KOMXY|nr:hypothetical protein FMA36_02530 [Komagataeibacter xylinus]